MTWDASALAEGARFVGKDEYLRNKDKYISSPLIDGVLTGALAEAADADGVLTDFSPPDFFNTYVRDELRNEEDGADFQLTYDRFTAMTLMEHLGGLVRDGLLGHRGKGDSYDYRLALPE
jgi:hypothetical protein